MDETGHNRHQTSSMVTVYDPEAHIMHIRPGGPQLRHVETVPQPGLVTRQDKTVPGLCSDLVSGLYFEIHWYEPYLKSPPL